METRVKDTLKLLGIIGTIMLIALAFGAFDRFFKPFEEETRRQTFETSQTYNHGMAVDLDNFCRQYRITKDANEKAILADTIRLRVARYTGELPAHIQSCVEETR